MHNNYPNFLIFSTRFVLFQSIACSRCPSPDFIVPVTMSQIGHVFGGFFSSNIDNIHIKHDKCVHIQLCIFYHAVFVFVYVYYGLSPEIKLYYYYMYYYYNNVFKYYILAGHPRSGCPARLRGHKGSGLWKVWTVPSPPLPPPLPSLPPLPPSLPRAKFDQAGSSRLAEITARRSARV